MGKAIVSRSFSALLLCLICRLFVDGPIAQLFDNSPIYRELRGYAVSAGLLLAPLIVAGLVSGILMWRDHASSRIGNALVLGSTSAIASFAANDLLLKPLFGRKNVGDFLYDQSHYGFSLFHGNWASSFPSGHMAIVAAFVSVMCHYFPRHRLAYVIFAAFSGFVLLLGEWHFVSDLIAGAFFGDMVATIARNFYEPAVLPSRDSAPPRTR